MGKKQLTPEEQVTRWEHIRAIENLVGKMRRWTERPSRRR